METTESSLTPSVMEEHNENTAIYEPRSGPHQNEPARVLDLASRTVRDECLFSSHLGCDIFIIAAWKEILACSLSISHLSSLWFRDMG